VQPELDIGPITLQTFGIMFALAFVAAGAVVAKRLDELGKPVDWAYEMIFAALVGGIVGARADFVIENYSEVKDDLLGNIFSGSGLVEHDPEGLEGDRADVELGLHGGGEP
jgi:phosphatidylglycerol:prolipoprotein diacylglycerol transferase